MATIYFDSRNTSSGSGTAIDPYRSFASFTTPADGDVLVLTSGATFRDTIPAAAVAANNLRIVASGSGRSILVGSQIVTSWSTTAQPGVFVTNLGSNIGGNVSENGVAMPSTLFTTDLATTAPLIVSGGFSFDTASFNLYIRPSAGTPTGSIYEVSQQLYGLNSTAGFSGLLIQGLEFRGFSRHGITLLNRTNTEVADSVFKVIGGYNTGTPVGNGVELAAGCSNSAMRRNVFEDIFDSPMTFQMYSTNNLTINNGVIENNTVRRCGLYGIEITIVGAITGCTMSNVLVRKNYIEQAGYAWRPFNVTGRGLHVGGTQATSTFSNVVFDDNTLVDCRWGISENLRGAVVSGIKFRRNVVTTTRSPANGRGLYASADTLWESNVVDGYTHGVVTYGATTTPTMTFRNITCVNVTSGMSQDGTTGTVVLRNSFFWHNGAFAGFISGGTQTRDFEFNAVRAASGGVTTGMTLSGTNLRPTTYQLGGNYRPLVGSSLVKAGTHVTYVRDANRAMHTKPPTIGAYGGPSLRSAVV